MPSLLRTQDVWRWIAAINTALPPKINGAPHGEDVYTVLKYLAEHDYPIEAISTDLLEAVWSLDLTPYRTKPIAPAPSKLPPTYFELWRTWVLVGYGYSIGKRRTT